MIKGICKLKKEHLEKILENIIGQRAWGVSLGHGSFVTFEFGDPKPQEPGSSTIHGEWHLWLYLCSWRIEQNGIFIAGCEDNRKKIESAIKKLDDTTLLSFNVDMESLDAVLEFENGVVIKLFSIISESDDGGSQHWMLFMPGDKILVAGPGSYLEVEDD